MKDNPVVVEKILQLRRDGKTHKEIADIVGISTRTLTEWKHEDWEFAASLKENEHLAKQLVEASLFKKATGFEHTVTTQVATKDGVETIQQTQYYPPSDTSIIFYLKNRDNDRWKDRREEDHRVLMIKQEVVSTLSTEELMEETKRLLSTLEHADQN